MNILRSILEAQGLIVEEAGGALSPAQSAFCAKICSKIITSQFCIVLLNNDKKNGVEIPNANVNMEYGLMLGFNKYVIPFQHSDQSLPFNVAGLDTVKYTNQNFHQRAEEAIKNAIAETTQEDVPKDSSDQVLQLFLMERGFLVSPIDNDGDRNLFRLGDSLGFNLLNSFSGDEYAFLGKFTTLRAESTIWRLRKLNAVLTGRRSALPNRVAQGMITEQQLPFVDRLFQTLKILVIVTSYNDKKRITDQLTAQPLDYSAEILTIEEMFTEVDKAIPDNA